MSGTRITDQQPLAFTVCLDPMIVTQRADSHSGPYVAPCRALAQAVNDRCDRLVCERSCQRTNDVYDFDIRGPTMLSCVVLLEYDLGMIAALPMHERANRVVLHHPISSGWRHVEHPVSATKSTPGSRLATLHRDRSLAVQPGGRPPGPEAGCAAAVRSIDYRCLSRVGANRAGAGGACPRGAPAARARTLTVAHLSLACDRCR